jgi:hypothetical protein
MLQSPPVSNLEFPPVLEDVKCRRYKWLRSSTTQHNVPKGLNKSLHIAELAIVRILVRYAHEGMNRKVQQWFNV